jgi:predicted amidohydrolase YtcJ
MSEEKPSSAGRFVEANAIEGDAIVVVGSNDEIDAPCRPLTGVVNLAGRLAICAFDDTLVHPSPAGSKSCVATCWPA